MRLRSMLVFFGGCRCHLSALVLFVLFRLGERPVQAADVTLMLPPSDPSRAVFEHLAVNFNAQHPDIRFRIIWSDISQKIHLLTAAHALPDLIVLPHFQLIDYHRELLDLDTRLAAIPEERNQFYPQLTAQCRWDGQMKMLPCFFNVPLLYYRPDLFRQAGLAYPDGSWNWEKYREAAKRLTRRGPDGAVQIWGTSLEQGWWMEWLGFIRQAGGDLLDDQGQLRIGEPATADALHFLHALIYQDHSAPPADRAPTGGLLSGKYAMVYGGHVDDWLPLRQQAVFEWDVAPLPAGPMGRASGDFAVAGVGIWNGCKDPDAAWAVLRFLCSQESGAAFCGAGRPPARRDVAATFLSPDSSDPRQSIPLHRAALIDSLAFARSTPKDKNFTLLALNYVGPLVQKILSDPDPSGIDAVPSRMQHDCAGYIATVGQKKDAGIGSFVAEIVVSVSGMGMLVLWLRRKRIEPRIPVPHGTERYFLVFVSPWILGMLLIVLMPMGLSFYWSHTDYNIIDSPRFVGMAQYRSLLFQDPYFWHSLRITFIYAIMAVPSSLIIALAAALLLRRATPGIGLFRTIFYLPSILPVASSGIMWAWLLSPRWGLANRLLAMVGIEGPGWLYDPRWALTSLVIISLWGFGGPMVIFLAGLKNIPASQYEAASVDGASQWLQFRHVTLPALSPVIFFNLTMGIIGALQVFDIAYVVGSAGPGVGEPQKSTYFYVLNLFEKTFINLNIGVGSAMAWVLFLIILTITGANFGLKRYWVFSDGGQ